MAAKIIAVGVAPPIFGGATGLALGWSGPVYWSLLAISVLGGVLAGYEHARASTGAFRGLVGGALFASGLLLAHALSGWTPHAVLPPPGIFLAINMVLGALFGAIGGGARGRAEVVAARAFN